MSREQDLLFCRIAIQSGKVTQEVGQKCLALANKFEAEGKRRPQVGAIFLQQNFLTKEDVQKIYGAVQKRMESNSPSAENAATAVRQERRTARPPAGSAAGHAGAPGPPAAARAIRVTHRAAQQKIAPSQLYLGIGFVVVFLICVGALIVMMLPKPPKETPVATGGIPKSAIPAASAPIAIPAAQPEKTPAKASADTKAAIEKAIGRPLPADKKAEAPPGKDAAPPSGTSPAAPKAGGAAKKTGVD